MEPPSAFEALGGEEFVFDVQGHLLEYHLNPVLNGESFWETFPQKACGEDDPRVCYSIEHFLELMFLRSDTNMLVLSSLPIVPEGSPLSPEIMDITRQTVEGLCRDERILLHAQAPDGTVKITRRSVSEGIGLSWGEGVLTYRGKDSPFSFHASGRLREVDVAATAAELSGQVFNLKNLDDFNGNYKSVEGEKIPAGGGTRATLKNQKGVVVNLVSTVEGRKFTLAREGMDIELKK